MTSQQVKYRVCDRCVDETLAVETHKISVNGYRYEIDLCDVHIAEMTDALEQWTSHAALVGEPTVFDKPRIIGSSLSNLPARAAAPTPAPAKARTGPVVADYADKWLVLPHAEQRMAERKIGLDEVLRCAQYPERVVPSTSYEGYYVHRRGDVKVVVHGHKIITTARAGEEMEMASGS